METKQIEELVTSGLAVLGSIYGFVRLVVLVTPTKEDDKFFDDKSNKLRKIWGIIVKVLSITIGLDPKQGLKE
jgi:hypothetical protein